MHPPQIVLGRIEAHICDRGPLPIGLHVHRPAGKGVDECCDGQADEHLLDSDPSLQNLISPRPSLARGVLGIAVST